LALGGDPMMRWPFVWRSTYEAALEESLFCQKGWDETAKRYNEILDEREKRAAARRAQRAAKKAKESAERRMVRRAIDAADATADTPGGDDVPAEVLEAIELRAGLNTRTGAQMLREAQKALRSGAHVGAVTQWMLRGNDPE
jgi:hypothetical protein